MGTNFSVPKKYKTMEKNYMDGVSKRKNFDIEQIYVTLLMKLSYYQIKCKISKLPIINEAVAYSNPIYKTHMILPRTIDYISGIHVTNTRDESCVIKIIWDGSKHGLSKTVIESFSIEPNSSFNFCFNNLYLYMAQIGTWVVDTSIKNVKIEYRCGILSTKRKKSSNPIYTNIQGRKFEFTKGSILELTRNKY